MRYQKISLTAFITFILTISMPVAANLPALFQVSQVLAQTSADRKTEADRLGKQGIQQAKTSQYEAALQSWQQALIIYREIKDRQGEGRMLTLQGGVYLLQGEKARAIEFLEQGLAIAKQINDPNLEKLAQQGLQLTQSQNDNRKVQADRLLKQGVEQAQTNQYKAALQSWQQALIIYREIKNRQGEGRILTLQGSVYLLQGEKVRAIEFLEQGLAIAKEINDPKLEKLAQQQLQFAQSKNYNRKLEANQLLRQGRKQAKTNQYQAALQSSQQALIIYREIKDREGEGRALRDIAIIYANLRDYLKAIDYFQQQLVIAREIKDRSDEGQALRNLSVIYGRLGDYLKAVEYDKQALAIAREIKDRPGEGKTLVNLGNAYIELGDYPKAIEYLQQGLAIAREIKDREIEGRSLGNLGFAYLSLGDYPKAVEYLQQSLANAKEIKDHQIEQGVLGNLGNTYLRLGDSPKAIEYHKQSLAIAREIKDRQSEGRALGDLGIAYFRLRDYLKAIEYHKQSLAIAKEVKDRIDEAGILTNLGNAYAGLGDYPKAIEYHKQSLAIVREIKNDRSSEGKVLGNLAVAYLNSGDYPKAIEYLQQDVAIARKLKDRTTEGEALNNLGLAFYKQGNLALAESTLIEAMKVKESLRDGLKDNEKVSIFDRQSNTYETLQQVLIAQNKTNAALEIAERGRARAFVELVASRLSPNQTEEFRITPSNIEQIKQIAKLQNATLVQYSIISNDFKVEGKQQSQESELYIWVIKPTGEVTFRKADLKPLWQKENTTLYNLVTTSRNSIGARGRSAIDVSYNPDAPKATNKLKRLHELLINPIADLLPKNPNDRVVFIPQSSLFLVPFPALQDANGKYLIEKHTILTSPSIQVLDLTRKQHQRIGTQPIQGNDTLIVGNPTMPFVAPKIGEAPQQLSPLPGAEKEAQAIASLLKTQPLIGNQATKAAVIQRLPQARFIHLATHGIFDDIQGLNSSIALAPLPASKGNDKTDGLLTASEILDLQLNAELVVLSACDTGRGRISGDGVIGLSRSLISAGVPSVLVSLWSVPDAPTALLMTEFYQNLQKRPDKALALRQAMLTTMKQRPNPVDWAAFTLIGEAE